MNNSAPTRPNPISARIGSKKPRQTSGEPLYLQIKNHLLEQIESQTLSPGDRVPSERELSQQLKISRMTARQALSELEREGYLRRVQGTGSFISEPKFEQSLFDLVGFSEDMEQRGLSPEATVLGLEVRPADTRIAQALQISLGSKVVRLERLRLASGEPMSHETGYFPWDLCSGLETENLEGSVYRLLENKYGLDLDVAEQSLEAVVADEYEAELLKVSPGTPLLRLRKVTFSRVGRAVEFVQALYRGDRYSFTARLRRPRAVAADKP